MSEKEKLEKETDLTVKNINDLSNKMCDAIQDIMTESTMKDIEIENLNRIIKTNEELIKSKDLIIEKQEVLIKKYESLIDKF